ncbi:hypothetical protein NN561_008975 [Cricetulus griseus]
MGCAPSIHISSNRAASHDEDEDSTDPEQRRSTSASSGGTTLVEPHPRDGGAWKVSSTGEGGRREVAGPSRQQPRRSPTPTTRSATRLPPGSAPAAVVSVRSLAGRVGRLESLSSQGVGGGSPRYSGKPLKR